MEHLGIVILAVFAIGIYSILKLVFVALFGKRLVKQPAQQQKKEVHPPDLGAFTPPVTRGGGGVVCYDDIEFTYCTHPGTSSALLNVDDDD